MSDYRSQSRDGRCDNRGGKEYSIDDDPPMSWLFIICNKSHSEGDFRAAFINFGEFEDIWVVKDRSMQENKSIANVKFTRTSHAAKVQEEMNGKSMGKTDRPLKMLVAANRNKVTSPLIQIEGTAAKTKLSFVMGIGGINEVAPKLG